MKVQPGNADSQFELVSSPLTCLFVYIVSTSTTFDTRMEASPIRSNASPDGGSTHPRSVFIKRLPEDEEPFDFGRATPDQQSIGSRAPAFDGVALSSPLVSQGPVITPAEPRSQESRRIEELMVMIQEMQTSHAHQISELREQYTAVSTQLEQLKSLLNDHFTSQLGSIHLVQSVSRHISSSQNCTS